MADAVLEIAVARLQRLIDAAAVHVVFPAVVRAHQTIFAHLAIL
jgi:hypothetical protein